MKQGKIDRKYESANILLDLAIEELVTGNYVQAEDHADMAGGRYDYLSEQIDVADWPDDLGADLARAATIRLIARRLQGRR